MQKTREDIAAEIAAHIAPALLLHIDATTYADALLDGALWDESDSTATINIEVPARHTVAGNPYIGTFDAPACA